MNHRGTYTLLALFFAGLGSLWLADYSRFPSRLDRQRLGSRVLLELLEVKPEELRKLEILGGPEPLVFERREGNRWQMTAPLDVAADPSMVESLAFHLKEMTRKPEAATLEGNPASFGLAPPERTIKLWGESTANPLAALEVGKVSLDRRFVRAVGSEGVEVVEARGLDLLKLPVTRWRDHELIRVPSFEVDSLKIAAQGSELKLRRETDAWRIVEPMKTLASELKVDGLIADLGSLRVVDDTRFVENNVPAAGLDRYGLASPALIIELGAGRGGKRRLPQVIEVGKPVEGKEGQVYARRGDQDDVVAVDSRVLKDLRSDPNTFRSPRVADINPALVIRIGVEAEGESFEVGRLGRDWAILRPSPSPGDRSAIESLLKSLAEIQTGIYLGPDTSLDTGLATPSMTLKVWQAADPRAATNVGAGSSDPNGELALSIRIGRRDAARRVIYAQLEGDRTILALPDKVSEFLPRNSLALRDRLVLAVAPEQVERLTLRSQDRKIVLNAPIFKFDPTASAPMGWWMVEPVDSRADAPSVGKLLKILNNLRAEQLLAESPKPEQLKTFGLENPLFTLTWSTIARFSMIPRPSSPGPGGFVFEDHSLQIGAVVPGKSNARYARIAGRPLVFSVGLELLNALDAEFHGRTVLPFEPGKARKFHLVWPDRSISLAKTDPDQKPSWSIEGAVDAPEFDPGRIGALVLELSALSTPRFLQYHGSIPDVTGLVPPRVSLRLEFDEGQPARWIRLGHRAGNGQLFATTAITGEGPVFLVPESLFSPWMRPPRRHDDLPDDVFAR